jgi:hypothetical protein
MRSPSRVCFIVPSFAVLSLVLVLAPGLSSTPSRPLERD